MTSGKQDAIDLWSKLHSTTPKPRFMVKIRACLSYVDKYPMSECIIGVKWFDDIHFLLHSRILGSFLKIKSNTVNYNFRTHGFMRVRPQARHINPDELSKLPDSSNWFLMYHGAGLFHRDPKNSGEMNEEDLIVWKDPKQRTSQVRSAHIERATLRIPMECDDLSNCVLDFENAPEFLLTGTEPTTITENYDLIET